MKRKVLDVDALIKDLSLISGEQFQFDYGYVGDDYQYGFIHCTKYLDLYMEDYDGYDEFGDEDNQLFINCRFRGKNYEYLKDSNNNLFISPSIKMKDIFRDNSTNKMYINPDSIKDWKVFKKIKDINKYCYWCSFERNSIETPCNVSLTESEILYLYDILNSKKLNPSKDLLNKLKYERNKINSKSLEEQFGKNNEFYRKLKFEPVNMFNL